MNALFSSGKGWGLAENHIGFTIGRHSYNIRDIEGAYEAYKSLLTNDDTNVHVMHSQILFQKVRNPAPVSDPLKYCGVRGGSWYLNSIDPFDSLTPKFKKQYEHRFLISQGVQDFVSVVQMYLQSQPDGTTIELPIPLVNFNKIDVSLFGTPHAGIVKQMNGKHHIWASRDITIYGHHVTSPY